MKTARQVASEFRHGDDGCLLRDDDVEQHRVHVCIWVGAAITDDDQPIIRVAGVANGRQHNAAGVDTGSTSVLMPLARSSVSRSVPTNGLMRCLTTIGSPASAAAAGWIVAP
jgi:hypothetical protein